MLLLFLALCLNAADAQQQPVVAPADSPTQDDDPSDVTRDDLMKLRDVFVDIGDYNGALGPAQQIVEQTSQRVGDMDPLLAPDLTVLAEIQRQTGEYALAEENYLRVISILESQSNKFVPELIEPYHGLGKTFLATSNFAAAMTVLDQARHVSRRNLGLFNIDQIAIIDDQTRALLGLGDVPAAGELQRDRLNLAIKTFGEDSPEVVPYHYYLADYYESSRLKNRALSEYQRAVEVLDATSGEYSADLLTPLTAIMALNMGDRDVGVEAVRVRSILDNNDDIDPRQRAAALASLGDWHLVRLDDIEDALSYYRAAYATAPPEQRTRIFSAPALLDFVAPMNYMSQRKAIGLRSGIGTISLLFTVEADGTTSGAEVLAVSPPDSVEEDYLSRIAAARFRPRLVDGEPVATPRTRMTHRFRYFAKN